MLLGATASHAEPIALDAYLASMDRTAVLFDGRIHYDPSDDRFVFYDNDKNFFEATLDTGREQRERVQNDCESGSFMVDWSRLCPVSGVGTVEIRGSRILISIDEITSLTAVAE